MKKQVALAVAAALSLSVAGTALAAPANPFVDVPANHWAYDALTQLQKDGVVTGYGDGTFRGDRNLTRYEMAAMIAKITWVDDKNGPLIKRLQSEFATELYNLGVRVDKLEKGASTIKFTGDARIRYQRMGNKSTDEIQGSRWQERVRINMSANVNDNINFYGRLIAVNSSNVRGENVETGRSITEPGLSQTGAVYFDRAEFAWKNNNWGVSAGRMLPKLGQGIFAWNDRVDGVIASYNNGKFHGIVGLIDNATAADNYAYGETAFTDWGDPLTNPNLAKNASFAQLGYQFTDKFAMTAMYANAHNRAENKKIKPWAIGANVQFANDWDLRGEYIHNSGDFEKAGASKNGYFARLTYGQDDMKKVGSYSVYAEYIKFGETSGAVAINGSRFDAANSLANRKGWGLGVTYVVGKNHNMQLFYHDVKNDTTGLKSKKQYTIATNFAF